MRQSREEKAKTHDRIVEIAAERIREGGIDGPGVAEIMQAAGLTHGGFYKHFDSRDDLVAEAAERAFTDGDRKIRELVDEADDPLAALIDWYVTAEHCANPGAGCAVAALGGDAHRADDRVRAAYGRQVERYLDSLAALVGGDDPRARAAVALSTLVGSVVLARAVDDEALSEEILRDVRAALKSL